MIPEAVIVHSSTGRLRIKIPSQRGNLQALKSCGDVLAACSGVLSIEVNPVTGSVLLIHQTTVDEIAGYARSQTLFTLEGKKVTKEPSGSLRKDLGSAFSSFDRQIQKLTDGELDLNGFATAALIVAGTAQLVTGNGVAIPWFAAYWYAFHLYTRSKEGEKK
jgi:hypothetical protein